MKVPPEKMTLREVASHLRCCGGKLGRLVYEGKLPPPDANGLFDREKVYLSTAWRSRGR